MRHIRRLVVAVRGPRWLPGEARSGLKAGRLSPVKPSSAPAVEMRHPSMAYTRPRRAAGTLDLRHHAFALGDFGVVFRDGVSRPSYVVSFETVFTWSISAMPPTCWASCWARIEGKSLREALPSAFSGHSA